jgi:hypothetical protein
MTKTWTYALVVLWVFSVSASAQEKNEAAPPAKSATLPRANWVTPLKVQIVLTKHQGDRKVASLPYTMTCNADDRAPVGLRMGIEVPVPVLQPKDGAQSFQYRSVGTNIDCRASTLEDGRYRVELTVEHSSVYSPLDDKDSRTAGAPGAAMPIAASHLSAPVFRNFRSNFNPVLRDGQTVQYTAATDPVSGEVVKLDVTVTSLK